jgi:DNA-binding MarR family transcriptional regulator
MQREELIEAIFETMHQMHRIGMAKFHTLLGQTDISQSQLELLLTVKRLQPISAKDIAAQMRLTPGAVTQLMEGLATSGYIERKVDDHDHRITNVYLADSGAQQLRKLWERRKNIMREVMSTLDTEELTVMLKVQEKMLHHIEERATKTKGQ